MTDGRPSSAVENMMLDRAEQLNPLGEYTGAEAIRAAIDEYALELAVKGVPYLVGFFDMPRSDGTGHASPFKLPRMREAEIDFKIAYADDYDPQKTKMQVDSRGLHIVGLRNTDDPATDEHEIIFEWPEAEDRAVTIGRGTGTSDVSIGLSPALSRKHATITLHPDHSLDIHSEGTNGSAFFVKGTAEGEEAARQAIENAMRLPAHPLNSAK